MKSAVTGGAELAASESGTRARVARLILEGGSATAAQLGEQLGLTPSAIRRHLDVLLDEGVVEQREARQRGPRGRGRPAKVFAITEAGRNTFGHTYDELAIGALRYLKEAGGSDAVMAFARARVGEFERHYAPVLAGLSAEERAEALTAALSRDGYAASIGAAPTGGDQICQHHCPVSHVAEEFPQLCEAETEVFGRLLGVPVRRLATIAHGDGVCTTHVTATGTTSGRATA